MHTATMEEGQSHLPDLLEKLTSGQEVVITRDGRPVARLTPERVPDSPPTPKPLRQLGTLRGTVLSMEHFDEPIEGLEEYM